MQIAFMAPTGVNPLTQEFSRSRSLAKKCHAGEQSTQCRHRTDCLHRVVGWLPVGAIGRTALGKPKTVTDPLNAVESEFDTDFAILTASQPGEATPAVAMFACSADGFIGRGCGTRYAQWRPRNGWRGPIRPRDLPIQWRAVPAISGWTVPW